MTTEPLEVEPTEEERAASLAEALASFEKMGAAGGDKAISAKMFATFIGALYRGMWDGFTKQRRKIEALERQIEALRADRPMLADSYRGVWPAASFEPYRKGAFVTHDGSLWIARTETRSKPGTADDWQLAVKRGADGKDLR